MTRTIDEKKKRWWCQQRYNDDIRFYLFSKKTKTKKKTFNFKSQDWQNVKKDAIFKRKIKFKLNS